MLASLSSTGSPEQLARWKAMKGAPAMQASRHVAPYVSPSTHRPSLRCFAVHPPAPTGSDPQAILSDFQEALREYRAVQRQISALGFSLPHVAHASQLARSGQHSVTQGGTTSSGRATSAPVERPVLPSTGQFKGLFKQYQELRRRLMHDTPRLRNQLHDTSSMGEGKPGKAKSLAPGSSARSCNETADAARSSAVTQWLQAKDYRRKDSHNPSASATTSPVQHTEAPGAAAAGSQRGEAAGQAVGTASQHVLTPSSPQAADHHSSLALPLESLSATHTTSTLPSSATTASPSVTQRPSSSQVPEAPPTVAVTYTGGQRGMPQDDGMHTLVVQTAAVLPVAGDQAASVALPSPAPGPAAPPASDSSSESQLDTAGAGVSVRVRAAAMAALAYKQRKATNSDNAQALGQAKGHLKGQGQGKAEKEHLVGEAEVVRASGDVYAGRNRRVTEEPMLLCPP